MLNVSSRTVQGVVTSGQALRIIFHYELPNDFLNDTAWIAVGCPPVTTAVHGGTAPVFDLRVETGVPNPFNPFTTVGFTLARTGRTRVMVVDVTGRMIAILLDRHLPAGRHTMEWDGRNSKGRVVSSGVYFMCVESGRFRENVKMLLVR